MAALDTTEGRIEVNAESPGLFLRVLTPANGVDPMGTWLIMPPGRVIEAADDWNGHNGPLQGVGTFTGASREFASCLT